MASEVQQCDAVSQNANFSGGVSIEVMETAARLVGYTNAKRYIARGEHLFEDVPLGGRRVLEVGCGKGTWAIWAALHGAKQSVGIEPEAEGSTHGTFGAFGENIERLGLQELVEGHRASLQEFKPQTRFDVIVMYNVINHLDEEAVISLNQDASMVRRYVEILRGVRSMLDDGGHVVVADCGRSNFWAMLGRRSPFVPTIEWEKHQDPRVWARVFQAAGFQHKATRWSPMYPLGKLSSNWPLHFMTISHFVITFQKV